jgi:hypothetical protein
MTVIVKGSWLFLLFVFQHASASTIDLGKIVMKLKSNNNIQEDEEDTTLLQTEVLSTVSHYMNDYFSAYYISTQQEDYFSYATMTVKALSTTDKITTAMEFGGMLTFQDDLAPSHTFIDILTVNAFEGFNLDFFIETLLQSSNDFLSNLSHILIEVRDDAVTEKILIPKENETVYREPTQQLQQRQEEEDLTGWAAVLVYGMAIVCGIMSSIGCYCLLKCCFNPAEEEDKIHVRSIQVPPSAQNSITKQLPKKMKKKSTQRRSEEAPTQQQDSYCIQPLSPTLSTESQDSSKFTYNASDMSLISSNLAGMSMMSNASVVLGNYSRAMGMADDDDEIKSPYVYSKSSFPKSSSSTVTFGDSTTQNTISTICNRYNESALDLIEEGDEENEFVRQSYKTKQKNSSNSLQVRISKYGSRQQSRKPSFRSPNIYKQRYNSGGDRRDYSTDPDSSISPASHGTDVVDDLNNLSMQIKMFRNGRRES